MTAATAYRRFSTSYLLTPGTSLFFTGGIAHSRGSVNTLLPRAMGLPVVRRRTFVSPSLNSKGDPVSNWVSEAPPIINKGIALCLAVLKYCIRASPWVKIGNFLVILVSGPTSPFILHHVCQVETNQPLLRISYLRDTYVPIASFLFKAYSDLQDNSPGAFCTCKYQLGDRPENNAVLL